MLEIEAKIQHLCTLVREEAFRWFDMLSADVENIENLSVDYYIKGLASYFSLVNSLLKQKRVMRRRMKTHAV